MSESATSPRRWHGRSLRLRLLLLMLAWAALAIGGVWYSATRLYARHVSEQYHEELAVHIRELTALVHVGADGSLTMLRPLSDPRYGAPLSGFYWQVSTSPGRVMRSASMTRGALDEEVAHSPAILHQIAPGPTGPAMTYGVVRPGPDGRDVHYVIATDHRLLDDAIRNLTAELTIWLAVLTLVLAAAATALVLWGFRPLDRLAAAVARLRGGDRDGLRGDYPSEIAPLVDDLNAYVAQNSAIVERGRVEAGALAHGLRTPLAVITDEAERLAQSPATADAAAILLGQAQAMTQQIEVRLARVRFAGGRGLPGTVSRLDDVLPPILQAMRRLHPDIAFRIEGAGEGEARFPMDPVDLTELLSNLLDNAGKWAAREVAVRVAPGPAISVIDDGPGLTPEQAEAATGIGTRFDGERSGSGLGLAIAADIVDAYGLSLTLRARDDGSSGLVATIRRAEARPIPG